MLTGSDDEEEDAGCGGFPIGANTSSSSSPYSTAAPPASLIIKGPTGSVRGKRNIVRKSISNYTQLVKQAVSLDTHTDTLSAPFSQLRTRQ